MPRLLLTVSSCALVLFLGGCADDQRPPALTKAAESEDGVRFQLVGNRLTVSVPSRPGRYSRGLLVSRRLAFGCGRRDQLPATTPQPRAAGRFPPGQRRVTVALAGTDPRFFDEVAYCGVEAKDDVPGYGEAFGYFVSPRTIMKATSERLRRR